PARCTGGHSGRHPRGLWTRRPLPPPPVRHRRRRPLRHPPIRSGGAAPMNTLTWLPRWIWLIIWFIGQIITSSWAVLKDLVTPGVNAHPGIARVRTDCRTDAEVTMLSAFITITPGTLTLGTEIDDDGVRWIYVHSLYDGDPAAVAEIGRAHV